MTEIEKKALAMLDELAGFLEGPIQPTYTEYREALCRVIEQHEAFRQAVSDAVEAYLAHMRPWPDNSLRRFIIAKPDPMVKTVADYFGLDDECVSEMLKENGLKIVEDK